MELFWTQITDAQPARPARTKAHGSAWGVSLLAYAVRAVWGIDLPETQNRLLCLLHLYESETPEFH